MEDTQGRLNRLEPVVMDIQRRVAALETQDAVADVHRKNVDTRLRGIEENLKWLVRLLLGAIILAFVAFIVSGGLHVST